MAFGRSGGRGDACVGGSKCNSMKEDVCGLKGEGDA